MKPKEVGEEKTIKNERKYIKYQHFVLTRNKTSYMINVSRMKESKKTEFVQIINDLNQVSCEVKIEKVS